MNNRFWALPICCLWRPTTIGQRKRHNANHFCGSNRASSAKNHTVGRFLPDHDLCERPVSWRRVDLTTTWSRPYTGTAGLFRRHRLPGLKRGPQRARLSGALAASSRTCRAGLATIPSVPGIWRTLGSGRPPFPQTVGWVTMCCFDIATPARPSEDGVLPFVRPS